MFKILKNTLYNMAEELYLCQKNDSNNPEILLAFHAIKTREARESIPKLHLLLYIDFNYLV